jgi:hypothetical protein
MTNIDHEDPAQGEKDEAAETRGKSEEKHEDLGFMEES